MIGILCLTWAAMLRLTERAEIWRFLIGFAAYPLDIGAISARYYNT